MLKALNARQAEISDLRVTVRSDQDIRWLNISMDDPEFVSSIQTVAELHCEIDHPFNWQLFRLD
jgi:hypothetical protein